MLLTQLPTSDSCCESKLPKYMRPWKKDTVLGYPRTGLQRFSCAVMPTCVSVAVAVAFEESDVIAIAPIGAAAAFANVTV